MIELGVFIVGACNRSVQIAIIDEDLAPVPDLTFDTSGLELFYQREGGLMTPILPVSLAATDAPHTDGGFIHMADGTYRLDLPDAVFLAGASWADISGTIPDLAIIGGRVHVITCADTSRAGLEHSERRGYHPDPFDILELDRRPERGREHLEGGERGEF